MNVDVSVTERIGRPVDQVAAFVSEPTNAPAWYRRITSAAWETTPPLDVGSRFAFRARFLRRDLAYTYEVTRHEPGEQLSMSTADGPFPMTTEYRWTAIEDGLATMMTIRNHGRPTGFSVMAAPIMSIAMRRAMRSDLRELHRLLTR